MFSRTCKIQELSKYVFFRILNFSEPSTAFARRPSTTTPPWKHLTALWSQTKTKFLNLKLFNLNLFRQKMCPTLQRNEIAIFSKKASKDLKYTSR